MKTKQSMSIGSQSLMNAELQLLRAHVENGVNGPAVILITSAESGDGKSLIANSLAECLARTGHKTALLDASREAHADVATIRSTAGEARFDEPVPLALPGMRQGITREVIQRFFDEARGSYEYTIVDTTAFLASDHTMVLASLADGIVLTVRIGRAPTENDHMLVRVLDQSKGNILGVVTATASMIDEFSRKHVSLQLTAHEATIASASSDDRATPPKRSLIAGMFAIAFIFGSFLGILSYKTGGYRTIIASSPGPAKAFVHRIVARMTHTLN